MPVDSPDGRCNCSVVSIVLVSQNLERKKSRERSENDTPYDNPRLTTDFRCIFERALYSVFRGPSKSDKRRLYTQTRARSATDAKLGSSAAGRKVLIEYRLQYCIFTENPAFSLVSCIAICDTGLYGYWPCLRFWRATFRLRYEEGESFLCLPCLNPQLSQEAPAQILNLGSWI